MLRAEPPLPVTAPAPFLHFSPPRESTALSHPATVQRLLHDCADASSELTIRIEQDGRLQVLHGVIRSVDANGALLHRLRPLQWHGLLAEAPVDVEVSYRLPTGLFRFQATLRPFEPGPSNPYCILSLPAVIHQKQARGSYRVNLPVRSTQALLPLEGTVLAGYCLNLSMEGCCCVFREVIAAHFAINDVIPGLGLVLQDILTFDTAATIRRIETLDSGSTRLGLRFAPLPPLQQRQLQAALTTLQRDWLRKQPRLK